MRATSFKAQAALLETLISVIFHVETKIEPYTEKLLDVIIEQIKSEDVVTKKVAIDAVYAITAIVKDQIVPYRIHILQNLKDMRCHKVKPVREAAGETYKLLKELQPPISEQDLALLEDRP